MWTGVKFRSTQLRNGPQEVFDVIQIVHKLWGIILPHLTVKKS